MDKYTYTSEALINPRYTRVNGVLVAIGGKISIKSIGPKGDKVIRPATQAELETLYKTGAYNHLIILNKQTDNGKSDIFVKKSDSGNMPRQQGADEPIQEL